MDLELTLDNIENAMVTGNLPHARRLLRLTSHVSYDRFVYSLTDAALEDIRHNNLKSAFNDVRAATLVHHRDDYSMVM